MKASDKQGNTALLLAVRSGSVKCVRALLDAKADVLVRNKRKQGVMELAVSDGVCALLRLHVVK